MTGPASRDDPCAHFRDLAAEYAVTDIDGRERTRLVDHLERCPPCRHASCEYAEVADALLEVLPRVEPPPGFAARVLARLERARRDGPVVSAPAATAQPGAVRPASRRHARDGRDARWIAPAACIVLVGVAGAVVVALGAPGAPEPPAPPSAVAATVPAPPSTGAVLHSPVTRGREPVGEIYAHPGRRSGDPTWLYLSLDGDGPDTASGTMTLQLCTRGGARSTAGALTVTDGYGVWAGPVPADPFDLTGAQLLRADGTRYATAELADP
ncbi:zf-HC2 domain-containing protein [Actinomycetospora chiangmaiensis]|uniref:zf-HC2 domain-containing protein n=1 Tax=Actinomycetospora chiangmaiensis TaxID=402650 RepID=UPI00039A12B8|nr:hypothetical protein [Actinomycetospora chiangmaiensis]